MHTVAVYGSLRAGLGNHVLLEDSKRLEDTTLTCNQVMVSLGGFPGLIKGEQLEEKTSVLEVYSVDDETFHRLDCLEGNGRFYTRELTKLDDGTEAWVYFLGEDYLGNKEVDSGDWKEYYRG